MNNLKKMIGGIALIFCLSLGFGSEAQASNQVIYSQEELESYVEEVSMEYGICPEIVLALIEQESDWKQDATNGPHLGLCQINPKWHEERMEKLGVTDLMDAKQNILVCVDYLYDLYERAIDTEYEDIAYVLMAYNMGESKAKKKYLSGKISNYANDILDRSCFLERIHEMRDMELLFA